MQLRLAQRLIQSFSRVSFGPPARRRKLRNQHVPCPVQHLFLTEGQRLFGLQHQQTLQHLGDLQKVALLHLLGVFFEAVLPVKLPLAPALAQVLNHPRQLAVTRHLAQADMVSMRKRDHNSEAASGEAEQIEALLLARESATADILDSSYPVVRVNYLLTDLESHSGTLPNYEVPDYSEQHLKLIWHFCQ